MRELFTDKNKRQRISGYSMLELLLVVVMIGILAAIAIPSLIGARRGSLEAMAKTRLMDLATRQEAFRSALGRRRYAVSFEEMKKVVLPDGKVFFKDSDLIVKGWIIDGVFDDPQGRSFSFTATMNPKSDSDPSYCVSEDGVLRREPNGGRTCDDSSPEAGD